MSQNDNVTNSENSTSFGLFWPSLQFFSFFDLFEKAEKKAYSQENWI